MSLAFLFSQNPTPMKLWSSPKNDVVKVRASDEVRKKKHSDKVEKAFEALTTPMTHYEVARVIGASEDAAYKYMLTLFRSKRVRRTASPPYKYCKL